MACEDKLLKGALTHYEEATVPVAAYIRAEKVLKKLLTNAALSAARDHDCGPDCTKGFRKGDVVIKIVKTTGFPSPDKRGHYRIILDGEYQLDVECKPIPRPDPVPPPNNNGDNNGNTNGNNNGNNGSDQGDNDGNQDGGQQPDCEGPSPVISYKKGDIIDFKRLRRENINQSAENVPGFNEYFDEGGVDKLQSKLDSVECGEGCHAEWDVEPEIKTTTQDGGKVIIVHHRADNDFTTVCAHDE